MIRLSKLNGKEILLNSDQIEYIDTIPESKLIMMNGQYHLVAESIDTIIERITAYKQECFMADGSVVRKNLIFDKAERNSTNDM